MSMVFIRAWCPGGSTRLWVAISRFGYNDPLTVTALGDDFVAGENFILMFNEQDKDFQRDALELQDVTPAAQPPGTEVKFIIVGESDRLLLSDWGGSHGTPPFVGGRILQHIRNRQRKRKSWLHLARHKT